MALHLYLVRHAQAADKRPSQTDKERPLTDAGKTEARKIATYLRSQIPVPDAIVASTAVRTRMTSIIIAELFGSPVHEIQFFDSLYNNSAVDDLLDVIHHSNKSYKSILLIGHNPGLSYLAGYLTGNDFALPTAGVVSLRFDVDDWSLVKQNEGKLDFSVNPSMIEP